MLSGKTNAILYWTQWKQEGLFAPHEFQSRFIDGHTIEDGFIRASLCDFPGYHVDVPFLLKNLIVPLEFTFQYFGLGFTLILLVSLFDSRKWKSTYFLLPFSVIAFVFFSFLLLYSYPRFILPFIPWMAIYLAIETRRMSRNLSQKQKYFLFIILLMLELPFIWLFRSDFGKPMSDYLIKEYEFKNILYGKKFVTNHIDYAYWNGMSKTYLVPLNINKEIELIEYTKKYNIKILLIEARLLNRNDEYIDKLNKRELKEFNITNEYILPERKRKTWILFKTE